nr:basic proline-rich protein-like [Equus asinus]
MARVPTLRPLLASTQAGPSCPLPRAEPPYPETQPPPPESWHSKLGNLDGLFGSHRLSRVRAPPRLDPGASPRPRFQIRSPSSRKPAPPRRGILGPRILEGLRSGRPGPGPQELLPARGAGAPPGWAPGVPGDDSEPQGRGFRPSPPRPARGLFVRGPARPWATEQVGTGDEAPRTCRVGRGRQEEPRPRRAPRGGACAARGHARGREARGPGWARARESPSSSPQASPSGTGRYLWCGTKAGICVGHVPQRDQGSRTPKSLHLPPPVCARARDTSPRDALLMSDSQLPPDKARPWHRRGLLRPLRPHSLAPLGWRRRVPRPSPPPWPMMPPAPDERSVCWSTRGVRPLRLPSTAYAALPS